MIEGMSIWELIPSIIIGSLVGVVIYEGVKHILLKALGKR